MTDRTTNRPLFLSAPTSDGDETLYTVSVDFPSGESVFGLIVEGNTLKVINWPDGETAEPVWEGELPGVNNAAIKAAYERAVAALPDKVELVYVQYDDKLRDEQIQAAFDGKAECDDPHFDDWESDARYDGTTATIKEYVDAEDLAVIEEDPETYDELRLAVEERDTSDPFRDLARNTGHKWLRYVGNWDPEGWPYDNLDDDIAGIADQLGIDPTVHAALLRQLVTEAGGGELYVHWYGAVDELIEACQRTDVNGQPAKTITWTNPELLVLDSMNGSGHSVSFPGTISLPFDPNRLKLDARGVGNGYSWNDVAGLASPSDTTTVTITQNTEATA